MIPGVWTLSGRADDGRSYCFYKIDMSHTPIFDWHIVSIDTFWQVSS